LQQLDAVVAASERLQALAGGHTADAEGALSGLGAAVGQAGQSLLRLAAALR
jgi:hypothetical protein